MRLHGRLVSRKVHAVERPKAYVDKILRKIIFALVFFLYERMKNFAKTTQFVKMNIFVKTLIA